MYFHNVVGTGSYTTSTTNMYNKDRFHVQVMQCFASGSHHMHVMHGHQHRLSYPLYNAHHWYRSMKRWSDLLLL